MAAIQMRMVTLPSQITTSADVRIALLISHIVPQGSSLPVLLKDWPTAAAAIKFKVDLRDASGAVLANSFATQIPADLAFDPQESSTAWAAIFGSTHTVQPAAPGVINGVATSPIDSIGPTLHDYHKKVAGGMSVPAVAKEIRQNPGFRQSLEQLENFHQPPPAITPTGPATPTEFHQCIARLYQYPSVLRLLRLIIDLELVGLKAADLPDGGSLAAYISDVGSAASDIADPAMVTLFCPWVKYAFAKYSNPDGYVFTTSSSTTPERFGILAMDPARFYATDTDIDGGGLGILKHVVRATQDRCDSLTALPLRRGKGLQVCDRQHAGEIPAITQRNSLKYAQLLNYPTAYPSRPAPGAPTMDAADVQRGYRIDVIRSVDKKDASKSLCVREVSLLALPSSPPRFEDAAIVPGLSTAPNNNADGTPYRLAGGVQPQFKSSQVFFRWDGWSLTVPRPRPVSDPPEPDYAPIKTHVIPKSLPHLRYGVTYGFRARGSDVGGDGCDPLQAMKLETDLGLAQVWLSAPFFRHHMVSPPSLLQSQSGGAATAKVIVGTTSSLLREQLRWAQPPSSSLETMQLSGSLDGLSEAGHEAVRRALRGQARFIDPAADGIVASFAWPNVSPHDKNTVPVTLLYEPADVAHLKLKNLLVEANRSVRIRVRAGAIAALHVSKAGYEIAIDVPPARTLEVFLRSLISKGKLSQFELYDQTADYYHQFQDPYSMLAGPLRLTVVHATEKPLRAPAFGAPPVVVDRALGATAAKLTAANVTLDAESTSQLELEAHWEEEMDEVGPDGSWPHKVKATANLAVAPVPLPAGHPWLGSQASGAGLDPGTLTLTGIHDFGDGKWRQLDRVFLLGTSRFARYFPTATNDSPTRFTRPSASVQLTVFGSIPPAPPQIAYMVPTIARSDGRFSSGHLHRESEAWGLRIYLQRGWLLSGSDERLAVVVTSTALDTNAVSKIGADPARLGDPVVTAIQPAEFRNGTSVSAVLRPKTGLVTGNDDQIGIVWFPVTIDRERNLLYADVVLTPRPQYRPFVRFALARYQAHALPEAQLSSTVRADYIQLGPKRGVSVTRSGESLNIAVVGPGTAQRGLFQTRMIAISEYRHPNEETWKEGRRVTLKPSSADAGENTTWSGEIPMTHGRWNRVTIEEFELTIAEDDLYQNELELELSGRQVFADSFEY
jgi:hypothetical protein